MFYNGRHLQKKSCTRSKSVALLVSLVLIIVCAVGGTVAWLVAKTTPVQNTFTPGKVSCTVEENFDANTGVKGDVKIKNTSDVNAYIRVRLVGYNKEADDIIGGSADWLNKINTNNDNWFKDGDYYYYKTSVASGAATSNLIDNCTLEDGQVLEILAEAIQATPTTAVTEAWRVTVDSNGNLTKGA